MDRSGTNGRKIPPELPPRVSVDSGESRPYALPFVVTAGLTTTSSVIVATTTSGGVNRLGSSAPAADPRAVAAAMQAAPTPSGHHSGPPQVAWAAVTTYRMAAQPR